MASLVQPSLSVSFFAQCHYRAVLSRTVYTKGACKLLGKRLELAFCSPSFPKQFSMSSLTGQFSGYSSVFRRPSLHSGASREQRFSTHLSRPRPDVDADSFLPSLSATRNLDTSGVFFSSLCIQSRMFSSASASRSVSSPLILRLRHSGRISVALPFSSHTCKRSKSYHSHIRTARLPIVYSSASSIPFPTNSSRRLPFGLSNHTLSSPSLSPLSFLSLSVQSLSSESRGGQVANPVIIVYSKPGCCLCDGVKEKLEELRTQADTGTLKGMEIEVRDITTRGEWESAYQYEIPVVAIAHGAGEEKILPRISPRVSVGRLRGVLEQALLSSS
eukprot:TRINITY_DN5664_c0_g1_i1.p1 TRINITY_DN5664_c0_g1~~TRINITY_DN5664_c0_g1_i1.p1  ORF type:complete len:331 (-),score=20.69 TRINITY_DN5664_c0_g1_i1:409-1401(-)